VGKTVKAKASLLPPLFAVDRDLKETLEAKASLLLLWTNVWERP
jgi:hypothetical protein